MFYLLKRFSQVERNSSKIHVCLRICLMYVCTHTYICVCMHTHIYMYIYVCVYTVKPFNGFNSLYFET